MKVEALFCSTTFVKKSINFISINLINELFSLLDYFDFLSPTIPRLGNEEYLPSVTLGFKMNSSMENDFR